MADLVGDGGGRMNVAGCHVAEHKAGEVSLAQAHGRLLHLLLALDEHEAIHSNALKAHGK